MNKVIKNKSEHIQNLQKAHKTAKLILDSDEKCLDNILGLHRLGNELLGSIWNTEFHIFGVISSETDHLPTKETRHFCSKKMLEKSDLELNKIIQSYREDISEACNAILLMRFPD